jgi:RNA polymerase sigma factor (TIGR02999 family)
MLSTPMATPAPADITRMLARASGGDTAVLDQLLPLVYDELHELAQRHLRHERPGHTLQTTALVHEVYLKLVDQTSARWQNRAHFFAVAAMAMRRILVNHAKASGRLKRGGRRPRVPLDDEVAIINRADLDLVALDEALERLSAIDPRKARLVELRFFGGLTIEETGEVLSIAPATVKRDWTFAKTWLLREVTKGDDAPAPSRGATPN